MVVCNNLRQVLAMEAVEECKWYKKRKLYFSLELVNHTVIWKYY